MDMLFVRGDGVILVSNTSVFRGALVSYLEIFRYLHPLEHDHVNQCGIPTIRTFGPSHRPLMTEKAFGSAMRSAIDTLPLYFYYCAIKMLMCTCFRDIGTLKHLRVRFPQNSYLWGVRKEESR